MENKLLMRHRESNGNKMGLYFQIKENFTYVEYVLILKYNMKNA